MKDVEQLREKSLWISGRRAFWARRTAKTKQKERCPSYLDANFGFCEMQILALPHP